MMIILKRYEAWVTSLVQNEFQRATLRLTFFYVLGIAFVLGMSSVFIYTAFSPQNHIHINPDDWCSATSPSPEVLNFKELDEHLRDTLALVDILVLIVAGTASYFLARKTLAPIEVLHLKQQRFIGDVAHELRTPLTVLKAGVEVLLRKPQTTKTYTDFLHESNEEIDRLTRLTGNLLSLLRYENAPTIVMDKVALAPLVIQQIMLATAYAQERLITIESTQIDEVAVTGNADVFKQLVQNLIKNAVDYNKERGNVQVSVVGTPEHVILTVTDTGVGIAQKDLAQIFDRFYKVDTSRTQVYSAGTGLGLSIVKAIVARYGGTITITSEEMVGTTVIVTFPRTV